MMFKTKKISLKSSELIKIKDYKIYNVNKYILEML
jgi:hypothetical protein